LDQVAAEGGTVQPASLAVPSRLTSRHRCPTGTAVARAIPQASTPGEGTSRLPSARSA
jgi:hypothetical protein